MPEHVLHQQPRLPTRLRDTGSIEAMPRPCQQRANGLVVAAQCVLSSISMTRPARLLATLLALTVQPAGAFAATFSVHDGRAEREIGEFTTLYIDSQQVASFRLDPTRRQLSLDLTIPGAPGDDGHERHRYALCGTITIRNAMGGIETHEVNGTGTLRDPDGHHFEALGAADFTLFYLADPADPAAAERTPERSSLCHAPIS